MNAMRVSEAGGCLCGATRYRVRAEPYFVAVCACSFCQRLTGSDYNVEPMFRPSEFELAGDAPASYTLASEGSGLPIHVHFCRSCGTSLYLRPDRFPDCVGIFAGTFDNPEWFRRDSKTTAYFFTEEAPRGMIIPAGYDTFPGHARALNGELNTPVIRERTEMVGQEGNHHHG